MDIDIKNSKYAQKAMQFFKDGYNCSQAVFLAFDDLYDIDHKTALKISSSFGGGMGRLREVCGAVSGMFMVAGMLYGDYDPKDRDAKGNHYKRIQDLAAEFEAKNGSIVCRNLLGLSGDKDSYIPDERTEEYYKKRPCPELVGMSAAIMEQYILEND